MDGVYDLNKSSYFFSRKKRSPKVFSSFRASVSTWPVAAEVATPLSTRSVERRGFQEAEKKPRCGRENVSRLLNFVPSTLVKQKKRTKV